MAVLYRKYRPQTFADVLNQKYIIQTLKNQVRRGDLAHAYLFTGSRGVGKTSVARIFAKAVNCEKLQDGEPCGKCSICLQITQGNFLDLTEIDAASYTGVDNVRDIIEHVRFSPSSGKYKVVIIDEVHMLSKPAFNALLKTLEEPPSHAIFILATTEIGKVLPTIISRTQRFDFKALSEADLEVQLKNILKQEEAELPDEVVALIAQNAEGSVRDSLSLLGKVLTLGAGATVEECRQLLGMTDLALCSELLVLIQNSQTSDLPGYFENLSEKGQDFVVFNRDFLEYLRKVLVAKITEGKTTGGLGEEQSRLILDFSRSFSVNDLIYTLRLFLKAYKEVQEVANPQIPVLLAALEAALRRASPPAAKNQAGAGSTAANLKPSLLPKAQSQIAADEPLEEVQKTAAGLSDSSLDETVVFWPQVIESIRKINTPLANMVKNSVLLGAENGRVILGVKFKFHKQSLESPKNQGVITEAIKGASGKNLQLHVKVISEGATEEGPAPMAGLTDALKIFGGELIE